VSYQILLGEKKYFVSTDGGGERQQWFALIREPAGGVDLEPTSEDPHPKLTRLRTEFSDKGKGGRARKINSMCGWVGGGKGGVSFPPYD
jgi:zeaxanthin epoxidase